jgi:hypothetical protein
MIMRRLPFTISLFTILFFLFATTSVTFSQQAGFTLSQEKNGIRLNAEAVPLIDLLLAIQSKSGIRFDLSEKLDMIPITHHALEQDWKALVSNLLNDFTKVEVWSDESGKSYVKVMGIGNFIFSASAKKINREWSDPANRQLQTETGSTVDYSSISLNSLPPHILMEPGDAPLIF